MRVTWHIGKRDVERVRRFYASFKGDSFVRRRVRRNVTRKQQRIEKRRVWYSLILCLATTQQRSGPNSLVMQFLRVRPFPLSYERCRKKRQMKQYAERVLTDYHLRRSSRMAGELAENLTLLESGLWKDLRPLLSSLLPRARKEQERKVADFLDDNLAGIGPKQARNLLQFLGLTRYEIPLDSRITKWLDEFGFPIPLSASALGDRDYYVYVLDVLQKLCSRARIYPCLLDAAVFVSFDKDAWEDVGEDLWRFHGA